MNGQTMEQQTQKDRLKVRGKALIRRIFFGKELTFDEKSQRLESYRFLFTELCLLLFAVLLSAKTAPFGTRPFGIALILCSGRHLAAFSLGSVIGALAVGDGILCLLSLLTLGLKLLLFRLQQNPESPRGKTGSLFTPTLAVAASVALSLIQGIYTSAKEAFSFHALFALLFLLPCSALLAILFYSRFESDENSSALKFLRPAGDAAFAFCLVYGVSGLQFFSLPLSAAAGLSWILFCMKDKDLLSMVLIGFGAGLGGGVTLLPILAPAGVVACVARHISPKIAPSLSLLCAAVLSFYTEGYGALTGTLPSLLSGFVLYLLLTKLPFLPEDESREQPDASEGILDEADLAREAEAAATQEVAQAIRSLSELLAQLSKRMQKPEFSELLLLCDEAFEDVCQTCPHLAECRTEHILDLSDVKNKAASALSRKGHMERSDIPLYMQKRCEKEVDKLVEACNLRYLDMRRGQWEGDGAASFATCYRTAARLLQDGSEARLAENRPDRDASRKAAKVAKDLQISFEGIVVRGQSRRTLTIYGVSPASIGVSASRLQQRFGKVCGTSFSVPSIRMESKGGILEMESQPILSFEVATASRRKDGESLCGDECRSFSDRSGSFYALLSDGMGSGREAATVAGICCAFTRQLAECGGSLSGIVESINAFLLQQRIECSATMDLLKADPYTGKAVFVKSGAVPTLLLRDGSILKISSVSMPIGITKEINAEQIRMDLRPGDLILMASDGVMPDFDSSIWLCKLLTMAGEARPALLCDTILDRAVRMSKRSDDASVCVIRVRSAA